MIELASISIWVKIWFQCKKAKPKHTNRLCYTLNGLQFPGGWAAPGLACVHVQLGWAWTHLSLYSCSPCLRRTAVPSPSLSRLASFALPLSLKEHSFHPLHTHCPSCLCNTPKVANIPKTMLYRDASKSLLNIVDSISQTVLGTITLTGQKFHNIFMFT